MRKMGMKQALLGGLAAAALLAGCDKGPNQWALTAQEDYYSDEEQTRNPAGRYYSNLDTSTTLYETTEQKGDRGGEESEAAFSLDPEPREGGTGGGGVDERDEVTPRIQGSAQEQEHLWLQQDLRVPYQPSHLDSLVALPLGTGKPLKAGPNGAWVQGTYAVEVGSGIARSIAPSSGSYQPQEPMQGTQAVPNAGGRPEPDNTGGMSPQ